MDPPIPKLSVNTISALDVPDTGQQGQLVRRESFGVVPRGRIPHYLLLESVLEQLCSFYESDDSLRRELFEGLLSQLRQLKFLDPTPDLLEMRSLRVKFRQAFGCLIQTVRKDLHGRPSEDLSRVSRPTLDLSLHLNDIYHQKRYEYDFEEIGKIAKGGFGIVCKAMRRTDRQIYAVKKIPFKYCNLKVLKQLWEIFMYIVEAGLSVLALLLSQVLREVELLAQLCHPNIVAYKSAWIENVTDFMTSHPSPVNSVLSTVFLSSGNGDTTSSPPYVIESASSLDTVPSECQKQPSNSSSYVEDLDPSATAQCVSLEGPRKESVDVAYGSASAGARGWKCSRRSSKSDSELRKGGGGHVNERKTSSEVARAPVPPTPREHIFSLLQSSDVGGMLYIQMELCSRNLADWLTTRNQRLAVPESAESSINIIPEAMNIFKQILKGVEYMHSKGFIHRDIKPQNILFDMEGSLVKLGDFGLATRTNQQEPSTHQFPWASHSGHTQGVGTSLYAAPEQRGQASYDSKDVVLCWVPGHREIKGNELANKLAMSAHADAVTPAMAVPVVDLKPVIKKKVDIYSLGVVLTELLCPFSTAHERITELTKLHSGSLPSPLEAHSEDVVMAIAAMCKSDPKERPSANELLISPLFIDKDKVIKDLRAKLKEKDEKLSNMAYELGLLKSNLEKMKMELKWYQDNSATTFPHTPS